LPLEFLARVPSPGGLSIDPYSYPYLEEFRKKTHSYPRKFFEEWHICWERLPKRREDREPAPRWSWWRAPQCQVVAGAA
jgi:hypothetical protein